MPPSGSRKALMCYYHFHIPGGIVSYCKLICYVYGHVLIRFVYAHLHMKCRRGVLLEYFGEEATVNDPSYPCCDVCESSNTTSDLSCEMKTVIQAVHDLPNSGEKKVNNMLYKNYALVCILISLYGVLTLCRLLSGFEVQQTRPYRG